MKSDEFLLVVVACGFGLTCLYLFYQVFHWKAVKAANHSAMMQARVLYKKLHAATLKRKHR